MVCGGADIQPDSNWAKVHNKILELLASGNFSARELRCLLFLLRRTYGDFGKKENEISLTEWTEGTNLKRAHVIATLAGLVARNVVTKTQTGARSTTVWAFNKYYENWLASTPVGTTKASTYMGTRASTPVGTTPSTQEGTSASTPVHEYNTPYIDIRIKEDIGKKETATSNDYFGMPRPYNGAHVVADGYRQDAAKEGVNAETFRLLCDVLIDTAGWRALVDRGDDAKLNFAKNDVSMLISLGVKTVDALEKLIAAYKAAYPLKNGPPQPRNITEYASQLQQGVAPSAKTNGSNGNGYMTTDERQKLEADLRAAKSKIRTAENLGSKPAQRDVETVERIQTRLGVAA